ncbi:MAG: thioesterase [Alphaproteobacteria bacterium]|nr:thioesterase [Alphaproteobacteria bacterium]
MSESQKWLPWTRTGDLTQPRMLLFPFAGGGASVFRSWLDAFPASLNILPVQLPGRETRINEPALESLDAVIAALVDGLRPLLGRKLVLFGGSMGAIVAHALALRLTQDEVPPELLIVGAHAAPHLPRLYPALHSLRGDAFWDALSSYEGVPTAVHNNAELRELLEPMIRADFAVVERRAPPPVGGLNCPIAAIGGTMDRMVPPERLQPWQEMSTGTFSQIQIPGDHFMLMRNPGVLHKTVRELLGGYSIL